MKPPPGPHPKDCPGIWKCQHCQWEDHLSEDEGDEF